MSTQAATSSARNNVSNNASDHALADGSSQTSTDKSSPTNHRAAPRRPAVPAQQRDAFESALRRHGQDDEMAAQAQASLPWGQPLPPTVQALPPPSPRDQAADMGLAGGAPRTAAAQDAVSTHLRALGATRVSEQSSAQSSAHTSAITSNDAIATHWQMQWAGATAPVQQVDLHRSETGTLQLDMTGQAYASDPARLARLRDRVAARAQAGQVFVQAHAPGAPGQPGAQRRQPFDDEGELA